MENNSVEENNSVNQSQEHPSGERTESQTTSELKAVPSLLEGINVERVGTGNWNFVFPNNARLKMSMSEVLLWSILEHLRAGTLVATKPETNSKPDPSQPHKFIGKYAMSVCEVCHRLEDSTELHI